jgi:lysophospholipase L1-like esterase
MSGNLARIAITSCMCLLVLLLWTAAAQGAPFTLAVLGDSISDTYFLKVSLFDRSWTDLLSRLRAGQIQIYNKAVAGSTSTAMLFQRQPEAVADLVRQGRVQNVCLIIGGNDLGYPLLIPNEKGLVILDSAAMQLVANIARAVDTVRSAGPVAIVIGNLPDLGDTPAFRSWAMTNPDQAGHLTRLTDEVNRRLEALARERHIPIVDLHSLTRRSRHPLYVGGIEVNASLFTTEGVHPSTIGSGLLGNVILEAFRIGYGRDTSALVLKDCEIVPKAERVPSGEESFDASRFVLFRSTASPSAKRNRPGHKSQRSYSKIVRYVIITSIPILVALLGCWSWFRWRRGWLAFGSGVLVINRPSLKRSSSEVASCPGCDNT